MTSGIAFKQGEILIVPFPFSNLRDVKQRPVLVLSKSNYNKNCEDIVTCGITSHVKDSQHSVLIGNNDLIEGSIPAKSRIKVDKLFTLEKSIVKKSLGRVNKHIMEKVKNEFFHLL